MSKFSFMAFAKGNVSTENSEIKRYVGVANIKVLAVNPTKAQIKEYQGYDVQEEPVYVGAQEIDGKVVPYARVTFLVATVPEKAGGISLTQQLTFFIRNQYRKGTQTGKYQVIDNYGNTAWGEEGVIKTGGTIMYANGPAKIIGRYRPAYVGEAALVNFLREYLVIGSSGESNGFDFIDGNWVPKTGEALDDCEVSFSPEEIQAMFKGDFKAVKDAIALQPDNEVKALFGIRTDVKTGIEHQDVYTKVVRTRSKNVDAIAKDIESAKNAGGMSNRYYEFTELHEYKVTPTDLSEVPDTPDPFTTTSDNPWG